jgi:hypothetical protein
MVLNDIDRLSLHVSYLDCGMVDYFSSAVSAAGKNYRCLSSI